MQFSLSYLKDIRIEPRSIVGVVLILLIALFIGVLLASFGAYYFYSYEAVNGVPETSFQPKSFSTSEIRKVEELLELRSERATGTSTPSFLRAFR